MAREPTGRWATSSIAAEPTTPPAPTPRPGDPRRYLIVALDTGAQHGAAVGVDIRMAGSAQIYGNDL